MSVLYIVQHFTLLEVRLYEEQEVQHGQQRWERTLFLVGPALFAYFIKGLHATRYLTSFFTIPPALFIP